MPDITTTEPRSPLWAYVRAVVKGLLWFVPGFLISTPATCVWARHQYAGEAQGVLAGVAVSFYLGVLSALAGVALLVWDIHFKNRESKWLEGEIRAERSHQDTKQ
jgi:hypothetical protein